jgi:hypothetical protein
VNKTIPSAAAARRPGTVRRLLERLAEIVDHRIGWYRLPKPLGLLALVGIRSTLREENLFDTTRQPSVDPALPDPEGGQHLDERSVDGSWNDPGRPSTGMAGSRFGRNVPIEATWPETDDILQPNPRVVSRRLMTRTTFVPAEAGNALMAGWLQFMIRDWFRHGTSPTDQPWIVPLEPDDDWPEPQVTVLRTPADPTSPPGSQLPPTYLNVMTHWWDGSQLYGNNRAEQAFLRSGTGGKLRLVNGTPPVPDDPAQSPARVPGFWLGVGMLQCLFAREHNSICERLAAAHPGRDDEWLFQRARLVTSGLLAKIHTTEWTPGVTAHPTAVAALHANWWGLAGQRIHQRFGRISSNEVISGIPGSRTEDNGVPFALTEEFVAVYRMHPLIPDRYDFRRARDDSPTLGPREFDTLAGPAGLDVLRENELADLLYTFGTMNPGLVTLHNFPRHLQTFKRPDTDAYMDLAATDILRCRELGVPRYAEFRRLMHLPVPTTFGDITGNPVWAAELRDVYGTVEQVDLIAGMYAEDLIPGFVFSDTAFRIFVLMASRRLNSDRFFGAEYYTPAVYTAEGLQWIEENTMIDVLLRHCPELAPQLAGLGNAFGIWKRSGEPS